MSKEYKKKGSYNKNFVAEYETNHKLKNGEWKSLYPTDGTELTVGEFLARIVDNYGIDNDVAVDFVLCYDGFSRVRKTGKINKKLVKLDNHDSPVLGNKKKKYIKTDGHTLGER